MAFVDFYETLIDGFSGVLGFQSRNNKYISQPNFYTPDFRMDLHEQWVSINGQELEIYQTTPELKIVVDRLALMMANGKWQHIDKNGQVIENSEFVNRLENPNCFQSSNEFLFQWFIQRSIYPSTFMYQLKGISIQETPTALWNLPPSRMTINRTGKIFNQTNIEDIIKNYTMRMTHESGNDVIYEPNEIIQFSMPNPDDPILGSTPLNAIRMPISNIRAAYGYRNVILTKKGAIGVWSSDAKDNMGAVELTPREEKKLAKQLVDTYGIGDHQAKVAISGKALRWNPATYPTKDLMLFEEIDSNKEAIIDLYGGNKNMFAQGSDHTYENVKNGEIICYQDTIIPIAKDLGNGLSKRWGLLERGERLCLTYDHVPVLAEHSRAKIDVIDKVVAMPISEESKVEILSGVIDDPDKLFVKDGNETQQIVTQDLINVVQSVSAGTMPRESAVQILIVSFGLSPDQANAIVPAEGTTLTTEDNPTPDN